MSDENNGSLKEVPQAKKQKSNKVIYIIFGIIALFFGGPIIGSFIYGLAVNPVSRYDDTGYDGPEYSYTNGTLSIYDIKLPTEREGKLQYYEDIYNDIKYYPYTDAHEINITIEDDGHDNEYEKTSIPTNQLDHDEVGVIGFKSLYDYLNEQWYAKGDSSSRVRPIEVIFEHALAQAEKID